MIRPTHKMWYSKGYRMHGTMIVGIALAAIVLGGTFLPLVSKSTFEKYSVMSPQTRLELFSEANARTSWEPGIKKASIGGPTASTPEPETTISETILYNISVTRGDTLTDLLTKANVPREEVHAVITALRPLYDLRRMRIGQTFSLTIAPKGKTVNAPRLIAMAFQPNAESSIQIERGNDGFDARIIQRPLTHTDAYKTGRITTSLYEAAIKADLPLDILMRLIRIFSFDVDFQREVQRGDSFAVLYQDIRDETKLSVSNGEIVWASMTLSGTTLEYAQFLKKNGFLDYFDRKGQSVKKTLMRTPIDGARLSSRYGKRRHPILGYTKMHRGVDFAAPKGVPIMAAGDGGVEAIGRNGAYGKYIRIRHNSTYKTAYAHLASYKRGLRKGSRVRQGSTIGFVGSTGRSTGPHLHYEVIKNGRQTNPMSVRLPAGDKLKGNELIRFLNIWPILDQRIAATQSHREVTAKK